MLSGLSVGARVILYDGSPFHPDVQTFLKFISDQGYVPPFDMWQATEPNTATLQRLGLGHEPSFPDRDRQPWH